jgi:hypothetical protein
MLMGYRIRPGQYVARATPLDLAPTLALLAGVKLTHSEGHVLTDALAPPPKRHVTK